MATPRKRWFRVADQLGADPIPNDELATFIRVLALLNTPRAHDLRLSELLDALVALDEAA